MPSDGPELRRAFDSPALKHAYVRRLFDRIAPRYDLITVLLSYGQDRRWKKQLVSMSGARPGTRALDLACGTGDIARQLTSEGASCVGLDLTLGMLRLAAAKPRSGNAQVALVAGDMMSLPFHAGAFDLVTTGYGLRNVPVIETVLIEIHRVLKPGGIFLSLDFDRPANAVVRRVYLGYLSVVGSLLGYALHGDPDTYRYIPESIRRYPGAERLCRLMRAQGFAESSWVRVLGGLMAIHRAVK